MDNFALGWGSLALINAAIASTNGRGPLKYFLLSLIIGPIMTILIASTYEDERGHLKLIDLWKGRR